MKTPRKQTAENYIKEIRKNSIDFIDTVILVVNYSRFHLLYKALQNL